MLCSSRRRPARLVLIVLLTAGATLAAPGCRRAPGTAPAPAPSAQAAPVPAAQGPPATMAVTAEPATVTPGGTVTLLWRLRPAVGWHLYWNGRNDSGFAPRQKLDLPPGWTAGPLQWPAPARHLSAGDILDHVYDAEFTLLQTVTAPAAAAPGRSVDVTARWEWLACRDSCVPGQDSLTVAIGVVAAALPAPVPSAALTAARARLPQTLPAGLVRTVWDGAVLKIERATPAAGRLTFMPAEDCGDLADLLHDGAGESLALRLLPQDGRAGPVRGVLVLEDAAGPARAFAVDVSAVPAPGNAESARPVNKVPAGG